MKKKILYLCDYSLEKIGGAQKSTITVCNQMSDLYDVYVTSEPLKNKELIENNKFKIVEFSSPRNKYAKLLFKLFYLKKIVNKYKPDIIHAQFAQFSYVLILAVKLKLIDNNIRCIYTDRHFFDGYNERYQNNYIKYINVWSDITFTTNQNKQQWENALKDREYNTKFTVIPNVLDDNWFENIKFKQNTDTFVIGFAGRYVDWKRWDIAEQICDKLKDENIFFKIAISSGANDELEQSRMHSFLARLKDKLASKLEVFIDLNEDRMKEFYSDLDIFILTSENESFGRTLIEAMTRHVVTISSNSGGAPDVVGRKELLYELDDINYAVSLIKEYKNDINKLKKDKEWFYCHVINTYKVDVMKQKLINVYEDKK